MKKFLFVFINFLFLINGFCNSIYNDDYYGDCNYINQEYYNEPLIIYTLTYSSKSNNIFISSNQIKNESSSSTLLYKTMKKSKNNQFEFITIASNDSVLINTIGQEPFLISDNKKEAFAYRWDKPLYHPYLTYHCNNTFANITAITYSIKNITTLNNNNSSVANMVNVLSILSGSISGVNVNETGFENESNISVNINDIQSFKTSYDRMIGIHYTYVRENNKNNYYLIKTILNNNSINNNYSSVSSYLVNTNFNYSTIGLSVSNNTVIIGGYDLLSNSSKLYQINIVNGSYVDLVLINEFKSIKFTNNIKSSNSNYLLFYSMESKQLIIYNIKLNQTKTIFSFIIKSDHKDLSDPNDDYESFEIQDLYASAGSPPIVNTTLSNINNGISNNNGNEILKNNHFKKILIVSFIIIGISCIIFGVLGVYIYKKKKRQQNNFIKIMESNKEKHQYPDDNITILLKNYR